MAALSPRPRPAAGSGRAAAKFVPKAEAPWLRLFHDLAAGRECHAGATTPDETIATADSAAHMPATASNEVVGDAAEALSRCAKLAVQLEQIAREIAEASRLAGLDFEIVGKAVFEQVFNCVVPTTKEHEDSRPHCGQEQQAKKEVEKTKAECVVNLDDDETTLLENSRKSSKCSSRGGSSSSKSADRCSNESNNTRAEEGKQAEACCVCESLDDKDALPPVKVSLMSGETMALPDVGPGTRVREVLRHIERMRPLPRNTKYSLLDGVRILTAEELVVGKCYTAVARRDRRLLRYPYRVGDLEVGDVVRTKWRQNSKSFHARIVGFTEEQPPRIHVQWQYTSGNDWDWQTAPVHFDWVLEIRRFALQQ